MIEIIGKEQLEEFLLSNIIDINQQNNVRPGIV